jgi:uncharacterized protein YbjT (DUF2867 family)
VIKPKIIVCGATGNQGGAVVRALLADAKWQVVALTRDPSSEAALRLSALGAEVVEADTADQASFLGAVRGAYGIFAVTQPWSAEEGKYNVHKEMIQGKNIIWASRNAGVQHIVLSSFFNPENSATGVSFLDTKLELEHAIKRQFLPYTVLRCGLYMDSINIDYTSDIIRGNYNRHAKMPYTALSDIGKFTAMIFGNPIQFIGHTYDLIGDYESGNGIAGLLSEMITSRQFTYTSRPEIMMRLFSPDIFRLRQYLEKYGLQRHPEIAAESLSVTGANFPQALTLREFFRLQKRIK